MALNDTGMTVSKGLSWKKRLGIILTGVFVVVACVAIRYMGGGPEKADATPPQQTQSRPSAVRTRRQYAAGIAGIASSTNTPAAAPAKPSVAKEYQEDSRRRLWRM